MTPPSGPSPRSGTLMLAIGVLHTVVGVVLGWTPLVAIASDGYVGAVERSFDRMAIFWFLGFGFVLMLAGEAVRLLEDRGEPVPPRLGWILGAVSGLGAAAIPASGFWLGLLPAGLIVWRAYARRK